MHSNGMFWNTDDTLMDTSLRPTTTALEKKTTEELLAATERPASAIRFTHEAVGAFRTHTRPTWTN